MTQAPSVGNRAGLSEERGCPTALDNACRKPNNGGWRRLELGSCGNEDSAKPNPCGRFEKQQPSDLSGIPTSLGNAIALSASVRCAPPPLTIGAVSRLGRNVLMAAPTVCGKTRLRKTGLKKSGIHPSPLTIILVRANIACQASNLHFSNLYLGIATNTVEAPRRTGVTRLMYLG